MPKASSFRSFQYPKCSYSHLKHSPTYNNAIWDISRLCTLFSPRRPDSVRPHLERRLGNPFRFLIPPDAFTLSLFCALAVKAAHPRPSPRGSPSPSTFSHNLFPPSQDARPPTAFPPRSDSCTRLFPLKSPAPCGWSAWNSRIPLGPSARPQTPHRCPTSKTKCLQRNRFPPPRDQGDLRNA